MLKGVFGSIFPPSKLLGYGAFRLGWPRISSARPLNFEVYHCAIGIFSI